MRRLHLLRRVHADELQAVPQDDPGIIRQLQPGVPDRRLLALDAAGGVEPVEAGRQLLEIAVDVAGVVIPGRQLDLLAELGVLCAAAWIDWAQDPKGKQTEVGRMGFVSSTPNLLMAVLLTLAFLVVLCGSLPAEQ